MSIYIGMPMHTGTIAVKRNDLLIAQDKNLTADEIREENWHKKRLFFTLLVFFLILGFQLFLRVVITQQSYNIESMRKLALQNDEELRSLKLAYDYYKSPIELAKNAEAMLAMGQVDADKFIKLSY
ncbi:MAG: hypothetical protein LBE20_00190 [Deltaproteobacteria bacterium]|jgi:hypothetical protein|nr:hypothetical protein [Deltaproteobacteria bacterium]